MMGIGLGLKVLFGSRFAPVAAAAATFGDTWMEDFEIREFRTPPPRTGPATDCIHARPSIASRAHLTRTNTCHVCLLSHLLSFFANESCCQDMLRKTINPYNNEPKDPRRLPQQRGLLLLPSVITVSRGQRERDCLDNTFTTTPIFTRIVWINRDTRPIQERLGIAIRTLWRNHTNIVHCIISSTNRRAKT